MRGLGMFFGSNKRNDPVRLEDPRPIATYTDSLCEGNAGLCGYTVLSRADPNHQGSPPPVKGVIGGVYRGPAQDFEA